MVCTKFIVSEMIQNENEYQYLYKLLKPYEKRIFILYKLKQRIRHGARETGAVQTVYLIKFGGQKAKSNTLPVFDLKF